MNMNVESHLPLAKKICSIYIFIVFVPFHKLAQAFRLIEFHVNSSSAFGLAPGSQITHIWIEICAAFPASIVPQEKNIWWGITSNLKTRCFVHNSKLLMPFRRSMVQVSIGNEKGPSDKLFSKTQYHSGNFLGVKQEKQETKWERLEVMSSTGPCLDTRPVNQLCNWLFSSKTHNTNQTYCTLSLFGEFCDNEYKETDKVMYETSQK